MSELDCAAQLPAVRAVCFRRAALAINQPAAPVSASEAVEYRWLRTPDTTTRYWVDAFSVVLAGAVNTE